MIQYLYYRLRSYGCFRQQRIQLQICKLDFLFGEGLEFPSNVSSYFRSQ